MENDECKNYKQQFYRQIQNYFSNNITSNFFDILKLTKFCVNTWTVS